MQKMMWMQNPQEHFLLLSLSDSPRSKYQSMLSDGRNPIRCVFLFRFEHKSPALALKDEGVGCAGYLKNGVADFDFKTFLLASLKRIVFMPDDGLPKLCADTAGGAGVPFCCACQR